MSEERTITLHVNGREHASIDADSARAPDRGAFLRRRSFRVEDGPRDGVDRQGLAVQHRVHLVLTDGRIVAPGAIVAAIVRARGWRVGRFESGRAERERPRPGWHSVAHLASRP